MVAKVAVDAFHNGKYRALSIESVAGYELNALARRAASQAALTAEHAETLERRLLVAPTTAAPPGIVMPTSVKSAPQQQQRQRPQQQAAVPTTERAPTQPQPVIQMSPAPPKALEDFMRQHWEHVSVHGLGWQFRCAMA